MSPLTSSIVSYPQRGPYGNNKFPGNTTGYLIRDLIQFYKASSILDPMEGSGTTRDVCAELDVAYDGFDLATGFDALTDKLPPKQYDLIFLHPPYWKMVRYSEDPRDLSNAESLGDYIDRLLALMERMSEYLTKNGHLAVLIGDMRKNGQIYPLGAYLQVFHRAELKDKLIKIQHDTRSGSKPHVLFAGRTFVPIMHEEVLVFRSWIRLTWQDLVLRVLREIGGEAHLTTLYEVVAKHPKTSTNPTWQATVRKTLQQVALPVSRGVWQSPIGGE